MFRHKQWVGFCLTLRPFDILVWSVGRGLKSYDSFLRSGRILWFFRRGQMWRIIWRLIVGFFLAPGPYGILVWGVGQWAWPEHIQSLPVEWLHAVAFPSSQMWRLIWRLDWSFSSSLLDPSESSFGVCGEASTSPVASTLITSLTYIAKCGNYKIKQYL